MRKKILKKMCIKIRRYWKNVGTRVRRKERDAILMGKYEEDNIVGYDG